MTRLLWLAVIGLLLPVVLSVQIAQDELTQENAELCASLRCKKPRGAWCQVVAVDGVPTASCVCPTNCQGETVKPVCSVFGKQYDNLCQFHRYQCKRKKDIPLAFEKPCVASQEPCTKDEYSQFPFRLLEWFMHLKEKNEFGRIDPNRHIVHLSVEEREAVAAWKFDALDSNQDDQLEKSELLQFRYALMPLEHCSAPFFTRCAKADKIVKKISAQEWMDCLKVYDEFEEEVEQTGDALTAEAEVVAEEEEEEDVEEEAEAEEAV